MTFSLCTFTFLLVRSHTYPTSPPLRACVAALWACVVCAHGDAAACCSIFVREPRGTCAPLMPLVLRVALQVALHMVAHGTYARAVIQGSKPSPGWERAWERVHQSLYTDLALQACDAGPAACAALLQEDGPAVEYHVDHVIYGTVKWLARQLAVERAKAEAKLALKAQREEAAASRRAQKQARRVAEAAASKVAAAEKAARALARRERRRAAKRAKAAAKRAEAPAKQSPHAEVFSCVAPCVAPCVRVRGGAPEGTSDTDADNAALERQRIAFNNHTAHGRTLPKLVWRGASFDELVSHLGREKMLGIDFEPAPTRAANDSAWEFVKPLVRKDSKHLGICCVKDQDGVCGKEVSLPMDVYMKGPPKGKSKGGGHCHTRHPEIYQQIKQASEISPQQKQPALDGGYWRTPSARLLLTTKIQFVCMCITALMPFSLCNNRELRERDRTMQSGHAPPSPHMCRKILRVIYQVTRNRVKQRLDANRSLCGKMPFLSASLDIWTSRRATAGYASLDVQFTDLATWQNWDAKR